MVLFSSIKEKRTTFTLIVRVFERITIRTFEIAFGVYIVNFLSHGKIPSILIPMTTINIPAMILSLHYSLCSIQSIFDFYTKSLLRGYAAS